MLRNMSRLRIIGGHAKGTRLEVIEGGTRPTPSRLREALFDILAFQAKGTFLDLYSGTGAVGLEAASRDWIVTCVESNQGAARTIRRSAWKLKLNTSVSCTDALFFVRNNEIHYDVVFADPPYELDLVEIFTTIERCLGHHAGTIAFQLPSHLDLSGCNWEQARHFEIHRYGSNSLVLLHRIHSATR
jgi:16S rRNA (guanine966-N2)-methyltransferase